MLVITLLQFVYDPIVVFLIAFIGFCVPLTGYLPRIRQEYAGKTTGQIRAELKVLQKSNPRAAFSSCLETMFIFTLSRVLTHVMYPLVAILALVISLGPAELAYAVLIWSLFSFVEGIVMFGSSMIMRLKGIDEVVPKQSNFKFYTLRVVNFLPTLYVTYIFFLMVRG